MFVFIISQIVENENIMYKMQAYTVYQPFIHEYL